VQLCTMRLTRPRRQCSTCIVLHNMRSHSSYNVSGRQGARLELLILITPLWHDGRGQPVSTLGTEPGPTSPRKILHPASCVVERSASFDSLEPPLTRECGSAVPTFRTTYWNCISLSLAHRSRLSRCECLSALCLPCLCKLAVTALAVMEPLVTSPINHDTLLQRLVTFDRTLSTLND
jgi:hypothetical protein